MIVIVSLRSDSNGATGSTRVNDADTYVCDIVQVRLVPRQQHFPLRGARFRPSVRPKFPRDSLTMLDVKIPPSPRDTSCSRFLANAPVCARSAEAGESGAPFVQRSLTSVPPVAEQPVSCSEANQASLRGQTAYYTIVMSRF